jgi:hypothetical protein
MSTVCPNVSLRPSDSKREASQKRRLLSHDPSNSEHHPTGKDMGRLVIAGAGTFIGFQCTAIRRLAALGAV